MLRGVMLGGLGVTGGVAVVLLSVFGLNWVASTGWIIIALVGCSFGALALLALTGRRPRVEIGPDGFVARVPFGSRSRRWSDIEGGFVVIKVGVAEGMGCRLTRVFKESAGIKPTTLFAGNDEAISGGYEIPIGELAELPNHHKGRATGAS